MDINSPKNETVTFLVYWDLKQYVQEELESDFDSKDFTSVLENVLTISGTIEKGYASSLRDYIRWKWPNSKLDILDNLKEVVQRSSNAVSDNSTSVQWHLVSSKDEGTKLDPVQALSASLKTHDDKAIGLDAPFQKLTSAHRHFLDYCRHVVVHLATPETTTPTMLDNVRRSSADDESHRAGSSIDVLTIGFPRLGILSAGATSKLIRTKGLRHAAKERDTKGFLGLCESARDSPLILYDEGKDAGWLVPTLSAVLHMVHLWTRDRMDLLAEIPAVDSCWDIGEAAITARKDDPTKILRSELDDDKSACVKDLVKGYSITLDELLDLQEDTAKGPKPMVKVEFSKLYAWDLLDIVTYKRKNWRQLKVSENSILLCNKIVVLVGQGMGENIRPAEGVSVCNAWSPIPPKHQYLTATVKCLQQMASRYGHNSPDPCFKLITNGFWVSSSENLFADCGNPIERPLKEGDANA